MRRPAADSRGTRPGRVKNGQPRDTLSQNVQRLLELVRTLALGLALAALTPAGPATAAQASSASTDQPEEEPLSEEVNDPTAHLTQVQLQDIYTPAEYGTNAQLNTLQIRSIFAVRPHLFTPLEQLIRPTIRIVTVPEGKGASTTTGFGDLQLLDLLVMPWPNSRETRFRWGIGPYMIFPTSTTRFSGQQAWQMGPAFAFAYRGVPRLNISGLFQQATSFAYSTPNASALTSIQFQPILSYQLGCGWYLKSSNSTWTFNLRHNTSTRMPLSVGFGKVWRIDDATSIDTSMAAEWMVYRQFASQTAQFTVRFQVSLLMPQTQL